MVVQSISAQALKGLALSLALVLAGCGGGGGGSSSGGGGGGSSTPTVTAAPTVATSAQQNGAVIVTLSSATPGALIYYTVDGTTPALTSQRYEAPFLVAANVTVKAIASSASAASTVTSQAFAPNIAANTLVWADEFSNAGASAIAPNAAIWGYDTGNSGFGNHELETYCTATSSTAPCDTANPNVYVGTDGLLHIVARKPSAGVYTSGRLKTQGLFSFQYGRLEVRARVPEAQGLWPAVWTLGNNINTVNWPASGEQDILERVNGPGSPDWNTGSVHGTGFIGTNLGTTYSFAPGDSANFWHTYGMIWKPGSVAYYIDDPAHPYATFTTASIAALPGAAWPFDSGQSNFIIMNLAVGGDWPGPPDGTTPFPSEMQVDYVRLYTTN